MCRISVSSAERALARDTARAMSEEDLAFSLAERQLDLLGRMAALDPPPCFMGGYAEDALLAGAVTRPHEDIDWLLPRSELALRLAQAEEIGFASFETWGEAAPGEPFYLFGQDGGLKLDLGIADEADGHPLVRVHRLSFEVDGREAPAGYQLRLPADTFRHPPVEIAGSLIRPASPLALYQIRIGIARQGSFGELSEAQLRATRQLRERFFPDCSVADLEPPIEPLSSGSSGSSK